LRARPDTLAPKKEGVPYHLLRMTLAYDDGIRKATTGLLVGGAAAEAPTAPKRRYFNKLRCRRRRAPSLAAGANYRFTG